MTHALQLVEKVAAFAFFLASMLGSGLTLTPQSLLAPLRRLGLVIFVLALNFLLAPAFAWLLTAVIPLQRGHAIALLLLGGAAGAPFLPKLVESSRGDLGVAAALMVLLTAGTILFLPFGLPIMIPGLHADAWAIARPLLLLIVLPLVTGMLIKGWAASLASRAAPILASISNAALLLLFVLLLTLNFKALLGVVGSGAILAAITYFAGLFALSWLLSRPFEHRRIFALATVARNFGAALVPAVSNFTDKKITVALIVNAIVGLIFSFLAAAWLRKRESS